MPGTLEAYPVGTRVRDTVAWGSGPFPRGRFFLTPPFADFHNPLAITLLSPPF